MTGSAGSFHGKYEVLTDASTALYLPLGILLFLGVEGHVNSTSKSLNPKPCEP